MARDAERQPGVAGRRQIHGERGPGDGRREHALHGVSSVHQPVVVRVAHEAHVLEGRGRVRRPAEPADQASHRHGLGARGRRVHTEQDRVRPAEPGDRRHEAATGGGRHAPDQLDDHGAPRHATAGQAHGRAVAHPLGGDTAGPEQRQAEGVALPGRAVQVVGAEQVSCRAVGDGVGQASQDRCAVVLGHGGAAEQDVARPDHAVRVHVRIEVHRGHGGRLVSRARGLERDPGHASVVDGVAHDPELDRGDVGARHHEATAQGIVAWAFGGGEVQRD